MTRQLLFPALVGQTGLKCLHIELPGRLLASRWPKLKAHVGTNQPLFHQCNIPHYALSTASKSNVFVLPLRYSSCVTEAQKRSISAPCQLLKSDLSHCVM